MGLLLQVCGEEFSGAKHVKVKSEHLYVWDLKAPKKIGPGPPKLSEGPWLTQGPKGVCWRGQSFIYRPEF